MDRVITLGQMFPQNGLILNSATAYKCCRGFQAPVTKLTGNTGASLRDSTTW